jgi:2Fe-2S ferredoxin
MPLITVLPHPDACPEGLTFDADAGVSICQNMLDADVDVEHACGMVAACTTCHVIVRQGFDSLNALTDNEEDLLDMAWGLTPFSRLSCQAKVGSADLIVEIPKYSINHAKEGH